MGETGVEADNTVMSWPEVLVSVPKAALIPFAAVLTQGSVMLSAGPDGRGELEAPGAAAGAEAVPQAARDNAAAAAIRA
ncbi:hypothetical protein GCM10022248_59350 [Nonomuraea soli]